MDEAEIRVECLRLAVQICARTMDDVVKVAEHLRAFAMDRTPPPRRVPLRNAA